MCREPFLHALLVFLPLVGAMHLIERTGFLPTPKLVAQSAVIAMAMALAYRLAQHLL